MIILAVVAAFLAVGGIAFANDGTNASDKAVQTIWKFPDGKPWPWMPLQQVTVSTGGGPGLRLVCRGTDPQLVLDLYRSVSLATGSAIVVRMSAKQGQNAQIFWGGDGYCEADSISQTLIADGKIREYIFRVPHDLKIRRLRFDPVDAPGEVLVESITVPTASFADVTVRNLYWEDAPLRASRPEQVTLVIRNLGWRADAGSVTLSASDGLRLRTNGRQEFSLPPDGFQEFRWTVEADGPVAAEVEVALACNAGPATRHKLAGRFTRPVSLPRASYVPPPEPVKTDCLVGVQYFPGWKEGTHFGWSCIAPFPERKPVLGWYDENDPEVTDWEIKWALEHGISFFKYCWYRGREQVGRPVKVEHLHLGHGIHEGPFHARYRDKIRFCIMWENQNGGGVTSLDDLLKNLLPFWLENYFRHPSYLKLDNRPVLFVFNSEQLVQELGGSPEKVRAALSAVRQACGQAGFDGLWFVGNGLSPKRAQDLGLDGTFNYNQTLPPSLRMRECRSGQSQEAGTRPGNDVTRPSSGCVRSFPDGGVGRRRRSKASFRPRRSRTPAGGPGSR